MKLLIIFFLSIVVSGCGPKATDNYLVLKHNGIEIFHSAPIRQISIVDSRIYLDISDWEIEVLEALATGYSDIVTLDVYFGHDLYTSAVIDFKRLNFRKDRLLNMPEEPTRIHAIEKAGIKIKKG